MQTIHLNVSDQFNLDIDQKFLLVPLPDRWGEFICDGYLEAMLLDYSHVWEKECCSNSDYCLNVLFKLFIDLLCDGYIARRSE